MDYRKIYDALMARGLNRIPDGYVERHHILPKCLGGTNDKSNLVALYPEEHFLAHQLLVKLYPKNRQLAKAVTSMCVHKNGKRTTNKCFGWIRRKYAESQRGSGNHNFGLFWVNDGTEERLTATIPDGWSAGRLKSTMEKNRVHHVGAKRSQETKEKIRLKALGRKTSDKQKAAVAAANKRRKDNGRTK